MSKPKFEIDEIVGLTCDVNSLKEVIPSWWAFSARQRLLKHAGKRARIFDRDPACRINGKSAIYGIEVPDITDEFTVYRFFVGARHLIKMAKKSRKIQSQRS